MDAPEKGLKVLGAGIEHRITSNERAEVRPVLPARCKDSAFGVGPHVMTGAGKRIARTLLLAHNMVVRLGLEAVRREQFTEVFTEKFRGEALIALWCEAEPDQMKMVGHKDVGGRGELVSSAGMRE